MLPACLPACLPRTSDAMSGMELAVNGGGGAPARSAPLCPEEATTLAGLRTLIVETVGADDNSDCFLCGNRVMQLLDSTWFQDCMVAVARLRNALLDVLRGRYPAGDIPADDMEAEAVVRECDAVQKLVWNIQVSASASRRILHLRADGADPRDEEPWPMHDPMGKTLALRTMTDLNEDPKTKVTDLQKLQDYLEYVLSALGLRRKHEFLYRNLIIDGTPSLAWVPVSRCDGCGDASHTIKSFSQYACSKAVRPDMHAHLHRSIDDKAANLERYFVEGCGDAYCPPIVSNKSIFSFSNGVWDLRCVAAARKNGYAGDVPCGEFTPYPLPVGHPLTRGRHVAGKHFDVPFPVDRLDLPRSQLHCNGMRDIFAAQGLVDVQAGDRFSEYDLFLGFYARMFFDLNELEEWQALLMLEGRPLTGKSTAAHFVAGTYDPNDVAVLSNNMEDKFGMQAILASDSKIFIGPEIKGDFCGNMAEMQSLISGDEMAVAVKNKSVHRSKPKITGMLFGNSRPRFDGDPHGAVARRIISVRFDLPIPLQDGNLKDRLEADRPLIMIAAVKTLVDMLAIAGKRDVWSIVPLAVTQRRCETTNPLVGFLHSGSLRLFTDAQRVGVDPQDFSMPMTNFKQAYNGWCKVQLLNPGQVNINDRSQIRSVFADFNLAILAPRGRDATVVGCAPRE